MRRLSYLLLLVASSTAAAPSSLRMRPRVAQAAPDAPPAAPDLQPDASPAPDATPDATPDPTPAPTPAPPEPPPPPPPPDAPPVEAGKTEVIRIIDRTPARQAFTGRAPTTVITREDLAATGRATLGEILQTIPAQANANNAQSNQHGDGSTRVNLRGLGAARTLTLVNGQRFVNSGLGADASVDLNMIPVAMIERIEVMKDGASARYGADAIGGVVNIITRPQYDGIDVSLLTSTSEHGDGIEYDASAVTGFTSKDKNTYLVMSAGYQHHDSVFARDRAFSEFQNTYDYATHTLRHYLSPVTPDGRLDVGSLGPGAKQLPGCTSSFCRPTADGGWANADQNDLYNEAGANYLYTPSTRWNVYGTGGNRINDHISAFIEGLVMHRESARTFASVPFDGQAVISKDSLYNPTGVDIVNYQRRLTELGPRSYDDIINMARLVAGVRGELPDTWGAVSGWPFEVSVNWGRVASDTHVNGQFDLYQAKTALGPSMYDAFGTPICVRVPGDASTKIIYTIFEDQPNGHDFQSFNVACTPLNILSAAGKIPKAQLDKFRLDQNAPGTDEQETLLATTGGKLVDLPNQGEITVHAGTSYRRELGTYDPTSGANTGFTSAPEAHLTNWRIHAYEGFADVAIVPIVDRGLAQRLEIDLASRYVHDHTFGSAATYKAGALFKTDVGLAARTTYATAWRTPSIFELQGGLTGIYTTVEDPCDAHPPSVGDGSKTLAAGVQAQCTAQGVPTGSNFASNLQTSVIGGNAKLRPESAATATIGLVYEPPPVPGLAVTADYWHIAIDDAIESLSTQTIFANCYERGIASFCDQISRDTTTHRILHVDQTLHNQHRTSTSGVDLALWYDARLSPELGHLHASLEGQYLFSYDLDTGDQVVHGAGYYDLGAYPHLRANLSSRWTHPGGASAGFSLRYVGNYLECAGNDCNNAEHRADLSHEVDRYFKLDLFGGYDVRNRAGLTSFQLGVNNVTNTKPPVVYNAAESNSDGATYDFVGRVFFVRISHQY